MKRFVWPLLAIAIMPAVSKAQNVFPATGNAGIGTTNPQTALQIGEFTGNNQRKIMFPGVYNFEQLLLGQEGNGGAMIEFVNHVDLTRSFGVKIGANVDRWGSGFYISAAAPKDSHQTLLYPDAPALFVNTSNNVGIGTNQPQGYKLAVAGNMIAEKIKVKLQGAWPDYVFANGYTLPTLQELDQYIVANGHLPNVPSAEEVKKDGIDMEEINKALLRKIEELTLYLIEMDKKMKALETSQQLLTDKVEARHPNRQQP